MLNDPDQAFFEFKKLKLQWKALSESDTRSKIIDKLFTSCLGWSESDIVREEHVQNGFIDYIFHVDGMPRFVLEAKKIGASFELPISLKGRRYTLHGALSKSETVMRAIEQTRQYCTEICVNYGVVSNGNQLIVFEAFITGKKWREGNAIVYFSLDDIEKNFVKFWNLLSKDAVRLNSLRKYVSGEFGGISYNRPLDKVYNKDEKLLRNHLAGCMMPFIKHFFEEITDEARIDILERCYVYNRSFQSTNDQIRSFFIDQLPPHSETYKIENFVEGKDSAGKFQVNFYKCAEYLSKDEPEGSLSLLLGGVGSGKTTFLHRFFKVVLQPEEKVLWFYVDFRTAPARIKDFREFLITKIAQEYENKYAKRLEKELQGLDVEKINPTIKDLIRLFTVLKLFGYTLSLVIDNVDQHYSLSPEIQHQLFLEAQYLTDTLKTITILSLREESFFKSALSGVFDAYYLTKFHIVSPNFLELIEARTNYLLEVLELSDSEIRRKVKTRRPLLSKEMEDLKIFFKIVLDSFRGPEGKRKGITRFVESIAGGDMRRALELFNLFLISGNTRMSRILGIYRKLGSYQIAYYELLTSIILGESRYYSSERSHVMNVFDVNTQYTNSHFLHLKILQFARDRVQYETKIGRGFLPISNLIQDAEKISISKEAIEDSLVRLARFKLIVFDHQDPNDVKTASYFKITQTGIYYLEQLSRRFVYIDLVWMDTPIADDRLERELRYTLHETGTRERFKRAEKFLGYLRNMERADFETNPSYYQSALGHYDFANRIIRGFNSDKRYISQRMGIG